MKIFLLVILSLSLAKSMEPIHFKQISSEIYLFEKEFEKIKHLNGFNLITKEIESINNSIRETKKLGLIAQEENNLINRTNYIKILRDDQSKIKEIKSLIDIVLLKAELEQNFDFLATLNSSKLKILNNHPGVKKARAYFYDKQYESVVELEKKYKKFKELLKNARKRGYDLKVDFEKISLYYFLAKAEEIRKKTKKCWEANDNAEFLHSYFKIQNQEDLKDTLNADIIIKLQKAFDQNVICKPRI